MYINVNRTYMKSSRINKEGHKNGKKSRQFVSELRANRPVRRLDLIILRVYPRRLIRSETYSGPVAAACGRDETGLVGIILWNKQVDSIRIGDIIRLESGWCQMRDGELVVSTGSSGKLRVIDR